MSSWLDTALPFVVMTCGIAVAWPVSRMVRRIRQRPNRIGMTPLLILCALLFVGGVLVSILALDRTGSELNSFVDLMIYLFVFAGPVLIGAIAGTVFAIFAQKRTPQASESEQRLPRS